jgi:hypothetical protein
MKLLSNSKTTTVSYIAYKAAQFSCKMLVVAVITVDVSCPEVFRTVSLNTFCEGLGKRLQLLHKIAYVN